MKKYGVLVISHGSRSAEWVRLVDESVSLLQKRLPDTLPVESSFLEIVEGRLIQDGIHRLERQDVTDIVVIPLFVSSGSTHIHEIGWAFGVVPELKIQTDLTPFEFRARIHFGVPIDDDPLIAEILLENARRLSRNARREAVLLIGHGSAEPGFHRKWRTGMRRLARRLLQGGGFAAAETAMLLPDQAGCVMRVMRRKYPECDILVIPLFLSEGYFTNTVIPSRLEEYDYRYDGKALLPHPLVSEWMERQVKERLPSS